MVALKNYLRDLPEFQPLLIGVVGLLWWTSQTQGVFADRLLTDEQLTAGWEESHINAVKAAVRDIGANPANQNYNALTLERTLIQDETEHERRYRNCTLVRRVGDTTWIRHFKEFNAPSGSNVRIRHVWIIDSNGIMRINHWTRYPSGGATNAIYQVGHEGYLSEQLSNLQAYEILPNRLGRVLWNLQRQDVRYRVDSNEVPRLEIDFPRRRVRPGASSEAPPTPGGDSRILLSSEKPHLPTLSRRYRRMSESEPFPSSVGVRYFYERSAGKPVFMNRVVYNAIPSELPGPISSDTRFERVESDCLEIPRMKIAQTNHKWSIRSDNKWTTIPAEDVPQQFLYRVEVVSDAEAGKCYDEFPEQFMEIRERLENLPVPSVDEVFAAEQETAEFGPRSPDVATADMPSDYGLSALPVAASHQMPLTEGEIVDAEAAGFSSAQAEVTATSRRSLMLAFGIGLLIAGIGLVAVFATARVTRRV